MAKKRSPKLSAISTNIVSNDFDDPAGVTSIIASMSHPMTAVIEAIRETILSADSKITEGVKWNSPSFYCNGWFATISGRNKDKLDLVLHHGAKVRAEVGLQDTILDSKQLLKWASPDRAIVTFSAGIHFDTIRPQLYRIVKQWTAHQKQLDK